jgi:hypothetical protein
MNDAKQDGIAPASPASSGNTQPDGAQDVPGAAPGKMLSPAARRALREAAERAREGHAPTSPERELHGRNGPEPTRYGDWEKNGILSDF